MRTGHITNSFGTWEVHYRVNGGNRVNRKWFSNKLEAIRFLHELPKPTAYEKIRFAMRGYEKDALKLVRASNRKGEGYRRSNSYFGSSKVDNALDRLEKRGVIRYRYTRSIKTYGLRGYWMVK